MPRGASAAGEAFELLASQYLSRVAALRHVAAPFYTRLDRGRWVQFDGLFARADGGRLILEAKFYDHAISLATPGVAARITFAKEAGAKAIVLCSREGFARDILRVKLPLEKVLLSWQAMHKGISRSGEPLLTAGLDPVTPAANGFTAASGARLITGERPADETRGFAFLPTEVERWIRRLPASPRDINPMRPPRRFRRDGALDVLTAWTIEDSLRGFAPAAPKLLEMATDALREGPLDLISAWKALWRMGFRGRKGGLKNAFDDLCVIGLAEKFRTEKGLFYGPRFNTRRRDADGLLANAARRWPAFIYFRPFAAEDRNKHALSARISERFAGLFPYARSLYNPAKVAGLLALEAYVSSGTSSTRPS
jgi:hypothetical protein